MRAALAIGGVELRRFFRDRGNLFFVFIFPLLLVTFIGMQFGGDAGRSRVALAGEASELRTDLVEVLEGERVAVTLADADVVREQLARGRTDVGVFVSAASATAYAAGEPVELEVVMSSQTSAQAAMQRVRTAVQAVASERAQVAALVGAGVERSEALEALAQAEQAVTPPRLEVVDVDEVSQQFQGLAGQFDLGAVQQTLLFVFLISLAGSATLIQARRLGVMSRTLAAPVSAGQAVGGQVLGRLAIALFQGGYIMLGTTLLFGVQWGNIGLALLIVAVFALVSAAAAMIIGSVMDNDSAASGVGVGVGLVVAAIGGSMLPPELFPETLRTVAKVTPHNWAYQAFAEVQRHNGTLADILPALGVLAAMAAVLLVLGTWLLRRSLARAL